MPISERIPRSAFIFQDASLISLFKSTAFSPTVLSLLSGLTEALFFYSLGIHNNFQISLTRQK